MFCTNCGSKLPEGARFCSVCGTRVATVNEPEARTFKPLDLDFSEDSGDSRKSNDAPMKSRVTFDWSNVIDEPQRKRVSEIKSPWATTGSIDEKEIYSQIETPSTDRSRTMSFIDIMRAEKKEAAAEESVNEEVKSAEKSQSFELPPEDTAYDHDSIVYTEVLDPDYLDIEKPAEAPKPKPEPAPELHIAPLYDDFDKPVETPFDEPSFDYSHHEAAEDEPQYEMPEAKQEDEPRTEAPAAKPEEPAVVDAEPEPVAVEEAAEQKAQPKRWFEIPDFLKSGTRHAFEDNTAEVIKPAETEAVSEAEQELNDELDAIIESGRKPERETPEDDEEGFEEFDFGLQMHEIKPEKAEEPAPEPVAEVVVPAQEPEGSKEEFEYSDYLEDEAVEPVNEEALFAEMAAVPKKTGMTIAPPADKDAEIEALKKRLAELMGTDWVDPSPAVSEPEPEPVIEPEYEPSSEYESEPVYEAEPEFEPELKPEPVLEYEAEPEPEAAPEPEYEPAAEYEPEPEAAKLTEEDLFEVELDQYLFDEHEVTRAPSEFSRRYREPEPEYEPENTEAAEDTYEPEEPAEPQVLDEPEAAAEPEVITESEVTAEPEVIIVEEEVVEPPVLTVEDLLAAQTVEVPADPEPVSTQTRRELSIDEILAAVLADESVPAVEVVYEDVDPAPQEEAAPPAIEEVIVSAPEVVISVTEPETTPEPEPQAEERNDRFSQYLSSMDAQTDYTVNSGQEPSDKSGQGVSYGLTEEAEETVSVIMDNTPMEESGETPSPKETDALSLEDLEKDLFGTAVEEASEVEQTKKIDKFYTLYRKNEEFQRLLDEEYNKLKAAGGPVPEPVLPDPEPEPKAIEDATIYQDISVSIADLAAAQAKAKAENAANAFSVAASEPGKGTKLTKAEKAEKAADKEAAAAAAVAAASAASAAKSKPEEPEEYVEADKGGGFLTVLAVIIAILLVILLAIILILNFAPDSAIAFQIDSIIENITSHFTEVDGPVTEYLL